MFDAGMTLLDLDQCLVLNRHDAVGPTYNRRLMGTAVCPRNFNLRGKMNRVWRVALALAFTSATSSASASTCYGTPAQGRLQGGVPLPAQGQNYVAYSTLGVGLGRTYVHETVRDIVVEAYEATRISMPEKRFMYGETGLATGGPFKPHRTHQSGISVDFMVPVIDRAQRSVLLPTSMQNKFGYALEFDASGSLDDLRIDFEAMAEHLYQLAEAAKKRQVKIKTVIFQKELTELLFQTTRGNVLRRSVPFMKTTPWIKHDEHYHVEFSIRCRPLRDFGIRSTISTQADAEARPVALPSIASGANMEIHLSTWEASWLWSTRNPEKSSH